MTQDKIKLQNQSDNHQSTIELLQTQIKQHSVRQEELQAKKIQVENELKEQLRTVDDLKGSNQTLGENYRTLKTALAQIKTTVMSIETK